MCGGVGGKTACPLALGGGPFTALIPFRTDRVRNFKRRVIPAKIGACGGNFLVAQRRAVSVGRTLLVGRTPADHGLAANQARPVGHCLCFFQCGINRRGIMAVDVRHNMPAIGGEALRRVVGKPALHLAVDGNTVVIVERNQLAQTQGTGQRTGFVRNAFHQTAIAQKHISTMIDNGMAGLVEFGGKQLFRQRHTHRVGNALTEWAGGCLNPGSHTDFRVTGRL